MPVGFVTSSPASRACASDSWVTTYDWVWAVKAVCPGSGTKEISEVGAWIRKQTNNMNFRIAILEHDSANNCPSATQVANSETSDIAVTSTTMSKLSHTYSTKPQVIGGTTYWLAVYMDAYNINCYFSWDASGGYSRRLSLSGSSYPTWPSDSAYHGTVDGYNGDVYAVYADLAVTLPIFGYYYNNMRP